MMSSKTRSSMSLLVLFVCLSSLLSGCQAAEKKASSASSSSSSSSSSFVPKVQVKRDRNLDHWDADTLAYHLDHYPGYNVAIMFYAQWDRNSHSLAPMWDRIATLIQAGSSSSQLIMALFDCEYNKQHMALCQALDVTLYPTLFFLGAGPYHDVDPITRLILGKNISIGPMGATPIQRGVKFQGNWQYGDAIVDWIHAMQALSNWHTWTTQGFGRRLRTMLLPFLGSKQKNPVTPLPIGIPTTNRGSDSGSSGSSSSSSSSSSPLQQQQRIAELETQVEEFITVSKLYQEELTHASLLLDTAIYPILSSKLDHDITKSKRETTTKTKTKNQRPYTDMYAYMHHQHPTNGWENKTNIAMQNCILETAVDYCQRVALRISTDLVDVMEQAGTLATADVQEYEKDVMQALNSEEPYCLVLEECVSKGDVSSNVACRPATCPFQEEFACRYLTACLDPTMQADFAKRK